MKKLLALCLAMLMALSLVLTGCGSQEAEETKAIIDVTDPAPTDPEVTEEIPAETAPYLEPQPTGEAQEQTLIGTWRMYEDNTDRINQRILGDIANIGLFEGMDYEFYLNVDNYTPSVQYTFQEDGTLIWKYDQTQADEAM